MIIVTGASGFIGSNLIKALKARGENNILGVDYEYRDYGTKTIFTPADEFYDNLDNYNIDAIFHEGAISSTTETDWKKLAKHNIKCTWRLIYECRDRGIPLQYASSASVYGNMMKEDWHRTNKQMNPLNLYAKSKEQCDIVAELVMNSSNPPKLLQGMRYFNVYGSNEDHKANQASPYYTFTKQLNEQGKIKLFEGSHNYFRDFISVEEVIDIKLNAFYNYSSGIYDVGTANPKSFYDVALELCGSDEYIEWIPMPDNLKEHYQAYSYADMSWLKPV